MNHLHRVPGHQGRFARYVSPKGLPAKAAPLGVRPLVCDEVIAASDITAPRRRGRSARFRAMCAGLLPPPNTGNPAPGDGHEVSLRSGRRFLGRWNRLVGGLRCLTRLRRRFRLRRTRCSPRSGNSGHSARHSPRPGCGHHSGHAARNAAHASPARHPHSRRLHPFHPTDEHLGLNLGER